MDPPDRLAPHRESSEPWPARSAAEVVFLPGERSAAERIARRLFHRVPDRHEYAGLAGAPDGARVEVGALRGMLYLEMGDPVGAAYRAHYYVRRVAGRIELVNEGFHIHLHRLQGCGLGIRAFHRQVRNSAAIGVHRILAVAGRRHGENGYYTWPRFGFEGVLPTRLRRLLPSGLQHARTVLDLIESDGGCRWWGEHGDTIRVAFDLTPGSRSLAAFDRYLREKTGKTAAGVAGTMYD